LGPRAPPGPSKQGRGAGRVARGVGLCQEVLPAEAAASAGAGPSPGAFEWLPSPSSLVLGPANLRPPADARGGRRALGAACRGTDCCVRCAIGVWASPPGRGVGSSPGACSLGEPHKTKRNFKEYLGALQTNVHFSNVLKLGQGVACLSLYRGTFAQLLAVQRVAGIPVIHSLRPLPCCFVSAASRYREARCVRQSAGRSRCGRPFSA